MDLLKNMVAFSVWEDRIAPVFDVAADVHLLEAKAENILGERQETFPDQSPLLKAHFLVERGVRTLVCGAITRPLQSMIASYGIEVIPFVSGDLNCVVQAYLQGDEIGKRFAMPGCCREGGHCAGRSRQGRIHEARHRFHGDCSQGTQMTLEDFCPRCGHRATVSCGESGYGRTCPICGTAIGKQP